MIILLICSMEGKKYGFRTSRTIMTKFHFWLNYSFTCFKFFFFFLLKFSSVFPTFFFCGSSWGASCLLCDRLLLSRSCRSRHSSESLHRVTVCFVMALRECGFPRQLHALSASCVSGPVSRVRALDPLTGSNPHSFRPSPARHAPLRNTRSLAQRWPARICFATKFVFLFSLSTVIFLCPPCYGSRDSTVCVREPFHAVLLAFGLNIVCVSSSIIRACVCWMWCWGSAVVMMDLVSVRDCWAFLCM